MNKGGTSDRRRSAERRGRWSEWIAALYLMTKGYRIKAMRFRTRGGEVDIIARRGTMVALVEVKARSDLRSAVDSVSHASQQRIRSAGDYWLARQPDFDRLTIRCDIIAVRPWRPPIHLEDAF
ncbi:YraN family protein [Peteryoungia desertarenae]|uniref:UPF0102 protein FE840_006160 n=1 Tax=Peteryoungia desertarenae TaxID=1813451 RepID=A0ABX6QKT8_9HYPH|nr:YraN family protein [Peteryoungia desertarenae]QLF69155.1 YraN family protein [Peteryoungia desertarenae]